MYSLVCRLVECGWSTHKINDKNKDQIENKSKLKERKHEKEEKKNQ